jgi:hypothetical protein
VEHWKLKEAIKAGEVRRESMDDLAKIVKRDFHPDFRPAVYRLRDEIKIGQEFTIDDLRQSTYDTIEAVLNLAAFLHVICDTGLRRPSRLSKRPRKVYVRRF